MTWSADALRVRGHDVVPAGGADDVVAALAASGARVVRDIVIDTDGTGALRAQDGDFWHHTDGVFLAVPPRWVVVEVVRAEGGGALHVLDAAPLVDEAAGRDAAPIWFGTERGGVLARLVEPIAGRPCVRYRADYMQARADPPALAAAHERVRALAAGAVRLGELPVGACLVTDNWRVLHRREAFRGARTIRRIWLDGGDA